MARGVRRTHTEKLQSELSEVRAAISQYEDSLDELRSREKGNQFPDRDRAF